MQKALIVVNPISGGKNKKTVIELISQKLSKDISHEFIYWESPDQMNTISERLRNDIFDIAIAVGGEVGGAYGFSLALKSDGTVYSWGTNSLNTNSISGQLGTGSAETHSKVPAQISTLSNITAISAGMLHGLALKSDGTVVAWGGSFAGQSNVPAGLNSAIAVAAGYAHSLALKSDGTVVAWGANDHGESTVPAGLGGDPPFDGATRFKEDGLAPR